MLSNSLDKNHYEQYLNNHPRVLTPVYKIKRLFSKHQSLPTKINSSLAGVGVDRFDTIHNDVVSHKINSCWKNERQITCVEDFYLKNNKTIEKLKRLQTSKRLVESQDAEKALDPDEVNQKVDCKLWLE
jgi:hypothetical protein